MIPNAATPDEFIWREIDLSLEAKPNPKRSLLLSQHGRVQSAPLTTEYHSMFI